MAIAMSYTKVIAYYMVHVCLSVKARFHPVPLKQTFTRVFPQNNVSLSQEFGIDPDLKRIEWKDEEHVPVKPDLVVIWA